MGGEPQFGVDDCRGPCDLRAINGGYSNHGSPDNPARVYRRGQTVLMKYARNNHGPGGFIRLTLVKPEDMMDKSKHAKNAFYYTCWGANPRRAASNELGKDKYGFSFIGSDAQQHAFPPGYYVMNVKIPTCVPDGKYVLGWVWYGGTGSPIVSEQQQEPKPWGYFGDYWSCSYIEIKGGVPLERECKPVFNNDMTKYSSEGCMSANDAPGKCTYEPCKVTGKYQKPKEFKDGNMPAPLTPAHFGAPSPGGRTSPPRTDPPKTSAPGTTGRTTTGRTTRPVTEGAPTEQEKKKACKCIAVGARCWKKLAARTGGRCGMKTEITAQPAACRDACCGFCRGRLGNRFCQSDNVKSICRI